ncbi:60S ribosomal protein L12 [Spatholobus suberectus]|nr:60S ribosomal protein L12 [Spatholobus suberectus]
MASLLVPKIDPLSLSLKKIKEDITKEKVKDRKGSRVTVKLILQSCQVKVMVVPSVATLVIEALKEPKRCCKKMKSVESA